jgi:UDP-N-acetylmuramoyl-tripeptide--D-alanyl-D-alanine ligase
METITFGPGGLVFAREHHLLDGSGMRATIVSPLGEAEFELGFSELYNLGNVVCAVAIGVALGVEQQAMAARTADISFSRLRGELIRLPGGSVLVNDCYNANPISMRAALDNLATRDVSGRRIAVLGGMGELGPSGPAYHHEAGAHARELAIDAVVGVGELARDYAPDTWVATPADAVEPVRELLGEGDVILVKGSRAIGLEAFTESLVASLEGVAR